MFEQSLPFFKSWFAYSGLSWGYALAGIGLAVIFGAIWLSAYWAPFIRRRMLWVVLVCSAIITAVAIAFVQIPLQTLAGQAFNAIMGAEIVMAWLLLTGIPSVLLSGLVQEAAKMLPILYWWQRSGRSISPKLGLAIGAAAGAGFGIFEAFWVHSQMFIAGWTPAALQTDGFLAIAGFWERFFAVGFHIAVSALVGYGLARGKGWQFYLIGAGLHALLNYSAVLFRMGYFQIVQLEVYAAVLTVVLAAVVIRLRWRAGEETETSDA